MKSVSLSLAVVFTAVVSSSAYAEVCGAAQTVFMALNQVYKEVPIGGGFADDGSALYIFDTPDGAVGEDGSPLEDRFSIVTQNTFVSSGQPTDVACIIVSGMGFQAIERSDFSTPVSLSDSSSRMQIGWGIGSNGNLIQVFAQQSGGFVVGYQSPHQGYVDSEGVLVSGREFEWTPAAFSHQ